MAQPPRPGATRANSAGLLGASKPHSTKRTGTGRRFGLITPFACFPLNLTAGCASDKAMQHPYCTRLLLGPPKGAEGRALPLDPHWVGGATATRGKGNCPFFSWPMLAKMLSTCYTGGSTLLRHHTLGARIASAAATSFPKTTTVSYLRVGSGWDKQVASQARFKAELQKAVKLEAPYYLVAHTLPADHAFIQPYCSLAG